MTQESVSDTPRTDAILANDKIKNLCHEMIILARTLERELAAEKLKRLQVEHERDCILEDLVAAIAAAKA